jgi:hypothetical protein
MVVAPEPVPQLSWEPAFAAQGQEQLASQLVQLVRTGSTVVRAQRPLA